MVGQGRSYREIMDTLGIPERSFYRYLSQAYEHYGQLLQEQDKNNLALELRVCARKKHTKTIAYLALAESWSDSK
jgi:hypothetical protein